jgi:hypothetical protein
MSSRPLQARAKLTPTPETRPATIEGWALREATNGTAVLQGPNGIWRTKLGEWTLLYAVAALDSRD